MALVGESGRTEHIAYITAAESEPEPSTERELSALRPQREARPRDAGARLCVQQLTLQADLSSMDLRESCL